MFRLPATPRRRWASLAIAAGLAVVAAVAWLNRSEPESTRYLGLRRPESPPVEVRSLDDARRAPADVRYVRARSSDPEVLRVLAKRRHLEFLDLSVPPGATAAGTHALDDAGLRLLAGLSKLRELDLGGQARITKVGLAYLAALPILESLSLARTTTDAEALEVVARTLPGLRKLDLSQCQLVGDAGLAAVQRLRGIKWLSVRGCAGITGLGFASIGGLAQLEYLDASEIDLGAVGRPEQDGTALAELAALPGLRHLRLAASPMVSDASLAQIAAFRRLEELDLAGNRRISVVGIRELPPTLRRLSLNRCRQLTDATAIDLGRRFSHLRSLDLGGCERLSDAGVIELLRLGGFRVLNLTGTDVSEAIVEHLLRHVELEELDLHVAWMTPQIKARLAALPRLSRLSVGF